MPASLTARLSTIGRPAWLATLCAAAALSATVAHWAMLLGAPSPPVGPPRQAAGAVLMGEPRVIAALFGVPGSATDGTVAGGVPEALPSVPVQVVGVVAAGKRSSALMIVDGKPLRSYAVGDLIAPSVRLQKVGPTSVTLDDGGRRRVVPAPAPTPTSVLGAAPPTVATGPR